MHTAVIRTIACLLIAGAAGCTGGPRQRPVRMGPVEEGPQTVEAARKYLAGRWNLEAFDIYPPGRDPFAVKGAGTLIYDEFGNLRMDIRPDPGTVEQLKAVGIEVGDGTISSDGRVAVDMQNRTLTYLLADKTAGGSGPLSLRYPRHWQVEGNVLTLTTRDADGKPLSVSRWRKNP